MFTGIIETQAVLNRFEKEGSNITFWFESSITEALKIDQSVSHNGICLTVVDLKGNEYAVTAIDETLKKTNLGNLKVGDAVNLERCMPANGRFDGHIVQGHVDQTAVCTNILDQNGSWQYSFEYDEQIGNVTVEKGSICINGVSLTCFNSQTNSFSVAIIPYTYENTNFNNLEVGCMVNLEFDIVGKYIAKMMLLKN